MSHVKCPGCGKPNSEFNLHCAFCETLLPIESSFLDTTNPSGSSDHSRVQHGDDLIAPGERVGHFEVLEKRGQGGMGAVYKARDCVLDRYVALKILRPLELGPEAGYEFLLKEAKMAGSLNHPNIVTVHNIAREEAIHFIAMEWLEGKTLDQHLPDDGLSLNLAMDYARQTAAGLSFAHKHGIVHRDIKPANLMVTNEGEVKILDFGVARLHQEVDFQVLNRESLGGETAHGVLKGTMPYMSPEQFDGNPVDHRSDIFSFGVLLYQMFTGVRPFTGSGFKELSHQILHENPKPITMFRGDLPSTISDLIFGCLEKDRNQRFQNMSEVIERLPRRYSDFQVNNEVRSKPVPKKRMRVIGATILLALGALALFYMSRLPRETIPRSQAIAVMPIQTINTPDPGTAALSDGLTVFMTNKLAQIAPYHQGVWIVPGAEVRTLGGRSPHEVHNAFGVNLLIKGELRPFKEGYQFKLILQGANSDRQLDTKKLFFPGDQFHLAQKQIVTAMTELLAWEHLILPRKSLSMDTAKGDAFLHYIASLGHLHRYDRSDSVAMAIESGKKAIAEDPQFLPGHVALARAYRLRWRASGEVSWLDLAEETARNAQSDLDYPDLLAQLGLIYAEKGRNDEARAAFQDVLTWEPGNTQARFGLARICEAAGELDKAEQAFRGALLQNPNDWSGYNKLGGFLYRSGQYEKAVETFRNLVAMTPKNAVCYANLAAALQMLGKNDEALSVLDKGLAVSPTASLFSNKGTVLFSLKRYDEALPFFETAAQLHKTHHKVWANLADAYRWSSQPPEKATEAYNQAIALVNNRLAVNPNNNELQLTLALYLAKRGLTREASERLSTLFTPSRPEHHYDMAVIYELGGNRSKALSHLQKALANGFPLHEIQNDLELTELRKAVEFQNLMESQESHPN